MALEPRLWGTLPSELLHLVFARLSIAGIGQLRVLSKEWKRNIDCKDSEFNKVFDATTHLKKVALVSWIGGFGSICEFYDEQADKWHVFETDIHDVPVGTPSAADGGLFCSPRWVWTSAIGHLRISVVNPLTRRSRELPPLLSMGAGDSDVGVRMVQFTTNRETKEYKVHAVCSMKTDSDNHLFAQVYDSLLNGWSLVDTREGRIIGWEFSILSKYFNMAYIYNCADRNLHRFNPSDIAPGLTMPCVQLINDHLFVLHKKAPTSSTNLVQDGGSNSEKYCISEFHLPGKATAWVKLRVHDCNASIYGSPGEEDDEEEDDLTLLACNGFLLVHNEDYDRVWLYNLSTCAWRNLSVLSLSSTSYLVMCEMNWSALP